MSCHRAPCIFSAEIVIKHRKSRVPEPPPIRAPVETLARGVKITQLIVSHAMRARLPRRIQRASPIPPRQRGEESAEVQVQQAGGRPWQGWWSHGNVAVARVSCMSMRRCAPEPSHSSISKTKERGSVGNVAVARVWRTLSHTCYKT